MSSKNASSTPKFAPDGGHYRREADGSLTCLDAATGPALAQPLQAPQNAPRVEPASDPASSGPKARVGALKPSP